MGVQHIHADGAIAGHRSAAAPCHSGIGDVGLLIRFHRNRIAVHLRVGVHVRFGGSGIGHGGIGHAHACRTAHACTAGAGALLEGRIRLYAGRAAGGDFRALSDMGLGGVVHKGFRSRASDTCGARCTESRRGGGGVAFIFRKDGQRFPADDGAASHQRFHGLIHHFYRRRKARACHTGTAAGCAASGFQSGVILAMHRDVSGVLKLGAFLIFFIVSDVGFRVRSDAVRTGCTRAAQRACGEGAGCADGSQLLRRVRFYGGAVCAMEVRAVSDACPGMAVVGLDVHAHTDTVPAGKRQSACQAEKVCTALRRDGRGAFRRFAFFVDGIGNIKIARAQIGVGGLLDLIHRHRTGAGESRRPACCADGYGL